MAPASDPPEAWLPARRLARTVLEPVERFSRIQAASGVVLLAATALALGWASSPWGAAYDGLFETHLTVELGPLRSSETLRFWIDEGLMVLFFFVVGLEIRRELYEGELSQWRRASLPLAAAAGGMVAPALIYLSLNRGGAHADGWGVPMATDIAFALGALTLLGRRVPPGLRVLLLAIAIIDDIGATLIIATFYSTDVVPAGLLIASVGVLIVFVMQRFGVRRALAYVPAGAVIWLGMQQAGVHPTLAGVVLGLMTPVRTWLGEDEAVEIAGEATRTYRAAAREANRSRVTIALRQLAWVPTEAVPPVVRLENALNGWVAFGVMPLFALANAGIPLGGVRGGVDWQVALGTGLGLVAGKPIGILVFAWVAVRLRLAALPRGVSWTGVAVVGLVGGVGFTMAVFVANLAHEGEVLRAAKLAIVSASVTSALLAVAAGRWLLSATPEAEAAVTATEAEESTAR